VSADVQLALQYAAVTLLVAVSGWVVLKKQAPTAARRLRIVLAVPLVRPDRPAWMRALGRRIAPEPRVGAGCGSCDGCG
jgi:hypothetical protein